mmetsp:Transcript_18995/g.61162  ORF Transcript_18995/g.61162 Transcript_18995/m.61162 type:complete len:316 (+) Transcript_18995:428-1375(+)
MAGGEAMTSCHVSAGQVSKLFFIFARFFRIKMPSHSRKVPGRRADDGTRTSVLQRRYRVGGVTHWKETLAIAGEAHKVQLGEWLLRDADADYCYIADGANSQQQEIMAHLASRRNKQTGKLESMAISIDAISDKTSAGAHSKLREALGAAAEAFQEVAELGLLDDAVEIVSNEAADGDAAGSGVAGGAAASDDDLSANMLLLRPKNVVLPEGCYVRHASTGGRAAWPSGAIGRVASVRREGRAYLVEVARTEVFERQPPRAADEEDDGASEASACLSRDDRHHPGAGSRARQPGVPAARRGAEMRETPCEEVVLL